MTLRTRWTNWRAKVHLRKLRKEHGRVEKRAKKKHDSGLLEEWEAEHAWEFEVIDAQIKENLSRDVLDQGRELNLPTPSLNDKSKWLPDEEFAHTGGRYWILTPEAMIELIGAIRKERQARTRGDRIVDKSDRRVCYDPHRASRRWHRVGSNFEEIGCSLPFFNLSIIHGKLTHDLMEPDEGVQSFTMWDAKPNQ
jgi:hypothetical protein